MIFPKKLKGYIERPEGPLWSQKKYILLPLKFDFGNSLVEAVYTPPDPAKFFANLSKRGIPPVQLLNKGNC